MSEQARQVAVVTGAAGGIGRALAVQLAARGYALALADWNDAGLAETAQLVGGTPLTRMLDVSQEEAVRAFATDVLAQFGHVDLVFNNAGVTALQRIQDSTLTDLSWVMGVNFWGVVHGTHAFLPGMIARNRGCIVNVSSLYGIMAWPAQHAYCASKFAVRGFTESMRHDLHGTGVRAISVHPGGIDTGIVRNARFTTDDKGRIDRTKIERDFKKIAKTTPDQAAATILRGIDAGRDRILVGPDAHLLSWITRLVPEHYFAAIRWFERLMRGR